MPDKRVYSDGRVDIIVIRANQLTNPKAPDLGEVNSLGVNVSRAIAWDGTTWPNNTDSNMVDDRSIKDAGNAQSRGYAQFEATLNLFYPKNPADTTTEFGKAYQLFKDAADRTDWYIITRVLQTPPQQVTHVAVGDFVSVYKVTSDAISFDTEGEDSYKYAINFLPQGEVAIYTQIVDSSALAPITVTNASGTTSPAVGANVVLRAVLNGKRATNLVDWTSSAPAVATVSPNGVVTAVSAGTANITASHPAGTTSTAVALTVT